MNKKYYWKMNGYIYEVTKEQYYKYRKERIDTTTSENLKRKPLFYLWTLWALKAEMERFLLPTQKSMLKRRLCIK